MNTNFDSLLFFLNIWNLDLLNNLLLSFTQINNILQLPGYNTRTYTPILCNCSQFSLFTSVQQNSCFLIYDVRVSAKQNNITSTDDNLLHVIQFQSHFLALLHKPEGRGFDSVSLEFFVDSIVPAADSAFNRYKYREYLLRDKGCRSLGLSTLPSSCTDCLETGEP